LGDFMARSRDIQDIQDFAWTLMGAKPKRKAAKTLRSKKAAAGTGMGRKTGGTGKSGNTKSITDTQAWKDWVAKEKQVMAGRNKKPKKTARTGVSPMPNRYKAQNPYKKPSRTGGASVGSMRPSRPSRVRRGL
jgi:hypothetical protein